MPFHRGGRAGGRGTVVERIATARPLLVAR